MKTWIEAPRTLQPVVEDPVLGFRADGSYWRDLGRPDDLIAAERDLADGTYPAD